MYSIAGVVISDRNNSSPQHRTMSISQFHLLHLVWCIQTSGKVQHLQCWNFVIVKRYDGVSVKHKESSSTKGVLWICRTSTQQHWVSYTVLYSVTSSAFKSLWASRRGFLSLTLCHEAKKYILLSGSSFLTRNNDLLLRTGYFSSLSEYKNTLQGWWHEAAICTQKDLEKEIMPFTEEHGVL